MLASLVRWQGPALRQLLPAAAQAAQLQQERGMKLFEIFGKEARQKRKAAVKEEMQRGYFDDFREFRDSKGKVFHAPEKLVPASHAPSFPRMGVLLSDGTPGTFPASPAPSSSSNSSVSGDLDSSSSKGSSKNGSSSSSGGGGGAGVGLQPAPASLVCLAFRAGAQPMLEAWAGGFSRHFQGRHDVALYELAVVEGVVMRMWPFKQLLLRSGAASSDKYALPCRHLHHFGAIEGLRADLQLTNLLTGYVFLVDAQGRLRWRASGSPSDQEMATLLRCTEELLQQQQKQREQQQKQREQQEQQEQQQLASQHQGQ